MPASAIANVAVDHCQPLEAIAGTLVQLAGRTQRPRRTISVPRRLPLRRIAAVAQATGNLSQAEAGQRQADQLQAQAEQLAQILQGEFNSAYSWSRSRSEDSGDTDD
jgi:hypothetical protein